MLGSMNVLKAAIAALAVTTTAVQAAVGPVTAKGRYIFDNTGARLYIKGIAYQPQAAGSTSTDANGFVESTGAYTDPLSDDNYAAYCVPALANFQKLGVNLVRVYNVNATASHTQCVTAMNNAGIYLAIGLSTPLLSIDRDSPSWTTTLYDNAKATMDAFATYSNVIIFDAANEVVRNNLTDESATALPFIKASVRDAKSYIASKGYKQLVGYGTVDIGTDNIILADYLSCGTAAESIDVFGMNIYRWCSDDSTYTSSGYSSLVTQFENFPLPAYFSEFGCITSPPRDFTDVPTIFGTQMTDVFSGAVAYEYYPDVQGYGLTNGTIPQVTTNTEFAALASQYAAATPTALASTDYTASLSAPACPTIAAASDTLPAVPNDAVCACMYNTLSCQVAAAVAGNATLVGLSIDAACGVAGAAACAPIGGNGTTGVYGAWEFCSPVQKLGYVYDSYFESQNRNSQACNFGGAAVTAAGVSNGAAGAASTCLTNANFAASASATGSSSAAAATGATAATTTAAAAAGSLTSGSTGTAVATQGVRTSTSGAIRHTGFEAGGLATVILASVFGFMGLGMAILI